MQDEGLLFSVLPVSTMIEGGSEKHWRIDKLLKENTLIAVISFPADVFYPIGVYSLGIIVKKGIPHAIDQNVLWLRLTRDGFIKKKGKRIRVQNEPDYFNDYQNILTEFITDSEIHVNSNPRICKACPINMEDPLFELVPEAYVDDEKLSQQNIQDEIEKSLREYVSYLVRFKKETEVLK